PARVGLDQLDRLPVTAMRVGQPGAVQLAAGDARARACGAQRLQHEAGAATDLENSCGTGRVTKHQPCDQLVAHLEPEVLALDFRKRLEGSWIEPHVLAIELRCETRDTGADDEFVAAGRAEPA